MITKKDILKIAAHVVRKGQGSMDKRLIHPARDWSIGLMIVAVVFLAFGSYGGYTFYSRLGDSNEVHVTNPVTAYKQEMAATILKEYGTRAEAYSTLRGDLSNAGPRLVEVVTETEDDASDTSEGEGEADETSADVTNESEVESETDSETDSETPLADEVSAE